MRLHLRSLAASACLLLGMAFLLVAFDRLLFTDVVAYRGAIFLVNLTLGGCFWTAGAVLSRAAGAGTAPG